MAIIDTASIEEIEAYADKKGIGITINGAAGFGKSPAIEIIKKFKDKELKDLTKDEQFTKVDSNGIYIACEDPQVVAQRNYRERQHREVIKRNAIIKKNQKHKNKKRMIKQSRKRNRK